MTAHAFLTRYGFLLLALLWLPTGVAVMGLFRVFDGPQSVYEPWPMVLLGIAQSLVFLALCGLPLALACRRVWRRGYPRSAWILGALMGTATVSASLLAGLLGPLAIAAYSAVLSVPVWIIAGVLRPR